MKTESPLSDSFYFNKPSLIPRIKAMFADTHVIILLMSTITYRLDAANISSGLVRGICFVLVALYEPILVTLGGTIGHRVLGLRVRKFTSFTPSKSEQNINFLYSVIRYIIKILLGWISLLTIHSNEYGQAIHDKLSNSLMTFA